MSTLQYFGITSPAASELFTLMNGKYRDALASRPTPWGRMVSGWSSTSEPRQKFPIDLTSLAGFREWVDQRDHKDGDIASFYLDSKPWERTIDVPMAVLKAKAFQPYVDKVPGLVRAANSMPNIVVANLLKQGKTLKGWDDEPFFGTHLVDTRGGIPDTVDNLFTNKPFNATTFAFAKKAFRAMKAPDGRTSLGLQLTHVLGGTEMEETFDQLFKRQIIANAAGTAAETNLYVGGAIPIIAPELDANDEDGVWYGLALNTEAKPFEQQWENDGNPNIKIMGDGSEFASQHNKMSFQGDLWGNGGYAIWHTIIRFEPT